MNRTHPLRADAERNREQLVAAAAELFSERGANAPMEQVARRAGVGVGTLYRRFPDREALIHAVALHILERLADLAQEARENEDAWEGVAGYLRTCAEIRAGGLQSALDPKLHGEIRRRPAIVRARRAVYDALDDVVRRAQRDGTLRADVGPGDIMLLGMLLSRREHELPERISRMLPGRYTELVIDGLRANGQSELPGTAPRL